MQNAVNCTTIANRLNLAMTARDMSVRALSAKVNVTQYTINAIRQRALAPDPVMLDKIAGALDLPLDYFTTEDDEKAMAYLRKDGQDTNEELKQAVRDTGDKPESGGALVNMKATFFDILLDMYGHEYSMEDIYRMIVKMDGMVNIIAGLNESK